MARNIPLTWTGVLATKAEKKVQNGAIKHAYSLGIKVIRLYFGPGITTGWPDVLFLIPGGRPLFIEFKAPGNIPTKKQQKRMCDLRNAGYCVTWCDSIKGALAVIDEAFKRSRKDGR